MSPNGNFDNVLVIKAIRFKPYKKFNAKSKVPVTSKMTLFVKTNNEFQP